MGDSILTNVNTNGLKRNTQKHSKSGARVSSLLHEIPIYDMTVFSDVTIYIGGNDACRKVDDKLFEETYDRLIGQIKGSNRDCKIFLCKIAPRGDTGVAKTTGASTDWRINGETNKSKPYSKLSNTLWEEWLTSSPLFLQDTPINPRTQAFVRCYEYINRNCQRLRKMRLYETTTR